MPTEERPRERCSASRTSARPSSRWSSCCCRSSRSSPTPRRPSSSSSSSNPVVRDAFVVSLKTSLIAQALIVVFGTPDGVPAREPAIPRPLRSRSRSSSCHSCCRRRSPGSGCSPRSGDSACSGRASTRSGSALPFTQSAVTVAVAYVASPLYIRQAIAAFEATDPNLAAASRTLGAEPDPHVLPGRSCRSRAAGLIAGLALSFARGLGEFGATIMFAGSLQGVTQTCRSRSTPSSTRTSTRRSR